MPTTWYAADLHLGHEAIIRLSGRPFRSASHMDGALIERLWTRTGRTSSTAPGWSDRAGARFLETVRRATHRWNEGRAWTTRTI